MLETLIERIRAAHDTRSPLIIQGGGSKTFYGGADEGEVLGTRKLTGIVDYQPKELVLTARAGTPLAEIEAQLAEQNQMLAFEPPHFDGPATLGGSIAAGLSGPRRPYAGAARDFVLGVRMIDGTGQPLRFGGQVIKNVAGYDVSRLMVGALGTLGLITEVSLKVLPKPAAERTLQFELDEAAAIEKMNRWAGQPLPLSATSWHAGLLTVRLSGAASAVQAAQAKLGGEPVSDAAAFWLRLRDQTTPFFDIRSSTSNQSLWRLAVKPTAPPLTASHRLGGDAQWIEWGAMHIQGGQLPHPELPRF
jgi:glycolate oxidase FAD binding subunit